MGMTSGTRGAEARDFHVGKLGRRLAIAAGMLAASSTKGRVKVLIGRPSSSLVLRMQL